MDQSTQDIRDLRIKVEQIEKDRAARIGIWETRIAEMEKAIRRFDLVESDVVRQGKTVEALGDKLQFGKEDRVRDIGNRPKRKPASGSSSTG
jgi:transcription elongation GreA/GreB family factor